MELELRQETVDQWETVCQTTWEQEETAEVIVPDACPDIWQVLDGDSRILIQRKEAKDGKAELTGLLKTTILYQPEGEGKVCKMEVTLPFSANSDCAGLTAQSMLHICARVLSVDIHLLNPRKILVRVGYQLELMGFAPRPLSLSRMVEEGDTYAVRQRVGTFRSFMTVGVPEKSFSYSDTLSLPGTQPDVAEILRSMVSCSCTEAKVIGSKLVFKGEAELSLLCRGESGEVFSVDFHLPYSQIMDAGENSEDAFCSMDIIVSDMKCERSDDDSRSIQVELELKAQAILRKQIELPLLLDLYSTGYHLECEETGVKTLAMTGEGEEQEAMRVVLETDGIPGAVLDARVRLGRTGQSRDGLDLVLTQEVEIMSLFESEDGPVVVREPMTVSHRLKDQEGEVCLVHGELLRRPTATPTGSGVEVMFPIGLRWMAMSKGTCTVISSVTVGETLEEAEGGPSAIIRAVRQGETLWDVAKSCRSTEAEIMEASALANGELYAGQMLLIPRKK